MEVMYESSWNDVVDWKTDNNKKLYTNYTDWLQDSSDGSNADSDGSTMIDRGTVSYYQSYPSHYYYYSSSSSSFKNGNESRRGDERVIRTNYGKTLGKEGMKKIGYARRTTNDKTTIKTKQKANKDDDNDDDDDDDSCVDDILLYGKKKLIARNGGHDLERKELPPPPPPPPPRKIKDDTECEHSENNNNNNKKEMEKWKECKNSTQKPTIKYSKSMRSLKDFPMENGENRINLKHSKSMRSLKNKDGHGKNPTSEKFSTNTIRKLLKIPEIIKTSSGNVKDEDKNPVHTVRGKSSLLKGFENPGGLFTDEILTDVRLSKLLVNSKPFPMASQTRAANVLKSTDEYDNRTNGIIQIPKIKTYGNVDADVVDEYDDDVTINKSTERDINKRLMDFYNKNDREEKSIFKTLTLRLKKKMNSKGDKSTNSIIECKKSDEYVRAGLYTKQTAKSSERQNCYVRDNDNDDNNVPSNESLPKDSDFTIPRPKLIVPVHTYGIRKRRTGNMMYSIRTRSDDTNLISPPPPPTTSPPSPPSSGDVKKTHHTSCPGGGGGGEGEGGEKGGLEMRCRSSKKFKNLTLNF
ncbi:hypothetical protein Phum_PHUM189900 [Pediculus humanus corporis]|uniref:Uncharacterized protein n=1 Tax=Pediculus humanus subsp. corporis TaxID=121224 RepID=E0VGN8_PEDHC|nr:uncharacterized protein Phum_PHUM189900 [Pediculus humanus corporis]EEB12544.1 hypothetical protein Phum_PHUM189900 [Pediculus humanus corporis]